MTVESPPFALQAGTYGAEQTRRAITSLLARGSGVGTIAGGLINAADMQISAGGGMSVNVGTGEAWIPGSTGASQSGYYGHVASTTNLAIAASNPTNPRIDSVTGTVTDAAYAGSTNTFTVQVNTGTPTAGATLTNLNGAPALPTSSLLLGYVLVPASASSIVSGDISNRASQIVANGAVSPVVTAAITASESLSLGLITGQTGYKVQIGATTISASGANEYTFTLGTAWTTSHVLCIAVPTSGSVGIDDLAYYGSGGIGLTTGFIALNTSTPQNVGVAYLSVGT